MAGLSRFWYPAFIRHARRLQRFLVRHQKDMVSINDITGQQLTELESLRLALDTLLDDPSYINYREVR